MIFKNKKYKNRANRLYFLSTKLKERKIKGFKIKG